MINATCNYKQHSISSFRSRSSKKKYKTQDDGLLYKNTSLPSAYSADTVQFIKSSESNEPTAPNQYDTVAESVIYSNLIGMTCILENMNVILCTALCVLAPKIVKFPEGQVHMMEGEKVMFQVEVRGAPDPEMKWYHNGEELEADYSRELSEDGSLTMPSAEGKHSGVYQLVAHNMAGAVRKEVTLTVKVEDNKNGRNTPQPQRQATNTALPVATFGNHVEKYHAAQNQAFKDEYQVHTARHQWIISSGLYITARACTHVGSV